MTDMKLRAAKVLRHYAPDNDTATQMAEDALLAALDLSEIEKHGLMTMALKQGAPTASVAAAILHGFVELLKARTTTQGERDAD